MGASHHDVAGSFIGNLERSLVAKLSTPCPTTHPMPTLPDTLASEKALVAYIEGKALNVLEAYNPAAEGPLSRSVCALTHACHTHTGVAAVVHAVVVSFLEMGFVVHSVMKSVSSGFGRGGVCLCVRGGVLVAMCFHP